MTDAITVAAALLLAAAFAACWPLLGRLDNELGGDVPIEPQPSLQTRIRQWLGVTGLYEHFHETERTMATVIEALTALAEQVNAVSAAQATSFHNLQAAIDKLKSGELTPEQQDAVAQIEKSLTTMAEDAQKADDGYEPTHPPADNGGDVPVEQPDVPVSDNGDVTQPVETPDGGNTRASRR